LDLAGYDPYSVITWGRNGVLVDLAPYIKRDSQLYADWYPSSINLFRGYGGVWALPQSLQIGGLYYNKNAFDAAGIAYPTSTMTYSLLKDIAVRMQQKRADGTITRWGWKMPGWRNWMSIPFAYGAHFVDNINEPTTFTGNTTQMRDTLRYIRELETSGAIIPAAGDGQTIYNAYNAFMQQRAVLLQSNTLALSQYALIKDFEWDVPSLPIGPAERTSFLNAQGWMMFSGSKNKEAAWEVIKFFTGSVAMKRIIEVSNTIPPSKRYVTDWMQTVDKPANKLAFFVDLDTARAPGALNGDVYNAIWSEVKAVWTGTKSPDAAIDAMSTTIPGILATLNK